MSMRNIKLIIEYDGTRYHGWQKQPDKITLQKIMEESIQRISGKDVSVISASRTDSGVHALAQTASFKTDSHLGCDIFQRALNAILPDDIRVTRSEEVSLEFHPRFNAKEKTYFYIIACANTVSPFVSRYVWRVPYDLDIKTMKRASKFLKGEHDFSAFRAAGCGAKTTIRNISLMDIEKLNGINFMTTEIRGSFIKITVKANAFLRYMVRNIVGTLVEIGRGKMSIDDMKTAIEQKDRTKTGPTAPAKGLFLEKIKY